MKPAAFLILLFLVLSVQAQQFGAFPPSTRWKSIRTDTLQLLFTAGAEAQAQAIATLIHRMARDTPAALGGRLRSIDMVLHSRTTLANGYVGLAPYRSEFYLVPPSDPFQFGNLPWAENLAVHEYRHVQQFNAFRSGGSRLLYALFGEGGLALAGGLSIPDWFWEGDAVVAETALTTGGRGRLPSFWNSYRSLWAAGRNYSWMKLRNGSLKDYVPNHYPLGYLLVNYGYLRYGTDFWGKVTQRASSFRTPVYPFQSAIKKETGASFRRFRHEAFAYYRDRKEEVNEPAPQGETVTDYYYPLPGGGDTLLYLRSSYKQPAAFYLRTAQGEERLRLKSIGPDEWYSYRKGTVAYTTYRVHPRYTLIDYSDIVLLHTATGKEQRITRGGRYFAPDLSPAANRLLAVSVNDSLGTDLHLIDAADGAVLRVFPGNGDYLAHPRWAGDTAAVLTVRTPDGLSTLQLWDLRAGTRRQLTVPARTPVGMPHVQGDTLYYSGRSRDNDEILALRLSDGARFVLTAGATGAYSPAVSRDSLFYTRFTDLGQRLQSIHLPAALWKPVTGNAAADLYPVGYAGPNLQAAEDRRFAERRYAQGRALFRVHSWTPDYTDPELSIRLYSDNTLNTFSNQLYYLYNRNETSHTAGVSTTYGGLFPLLSAGAELTRGRTLRLPGRTVSLSSRELFFGYAVPLVLTGGRAFRSLRFGSTFTYNETSGQGPFRDSVRTSAFRYLTHAATFSLARPRAVQEILPSLSAALTVQHRHTLGRRGWQFVSAASATLPGPGNTVFQFQGIVQDRDTLARLFSDRFSPARGYDRIYYPKMWKVSGNFHFPLLYPDIGAANIVYLLRVRGNAFFDYSRLYGNEKTFSIPARSTGLEVFFDTRWLNTLPLTFGVRYSSLLDGRGKGYAVELALPLDLIPD